MPMFISRRCRIGPFTTITGVAPQVVDMMPWMLNVSVQTASSAAITTGRYSGLHPAITALTATFSTVTGARFGGTIATTSRGSRRVPVSIHITRSGVGGTTGKPSVNPRSNMNSKTSSASPSSIRRAVSLSPRAFASSRSAIPGSTDLDPHPGRDSGYESQSRAGDCLPDSRDNSANISRQSSRPKPTKRRCSWPCASARMIVGTVSRSYSKETLSAESSSIGAVSAYRSTSFALPAASWPTAHTSTDAPNARCAASISGIVNPQVGQSSLTKQSRAPFADGNDRAVPLASRNSNAGNESAGESFIPAPPQSRWTRAASGIDSAWANRTRPRRLSAPCPRRRRQSAPRRRSAGSRCS